ncbi:hypothetical protein IM660_19150 [Ruania alkalisoli]|uniref:Uncharacterized protein n=1 Tax=Ruania alkalisoli TaxID=2779775 RepID=A0A7M1SVL0_9MICO|nr:hypothetical protein [Ruania alkalisoli]QOR70663.1 hypothetical protein IM660_19150 [Ruania alkalisoli]
MNTHALSRRQVIATAGATIGAAAVGMATASPSVATSARAASQTDSVPEFWYQDNNLGQGGGVPPDFRARYDDLAAWDKARDRMHTFSIGQNALIKQGLRDDPTLLASMAAAHADQHFAYNVTQATTWWWGYYRQTGEIPPGRPNFTRTINELRDLVSAGFNLTDIMLQSVLSKPGPGRFLGYSMERRIQDVVEFNDQVRGEFPGVRIGLITPLTNPEIHPPWRETWAWVQSELRSAGHELDFIHFDKPFEHPRLELESPSGVMTWEKMIEVEQYAKSLGITYGIQCTDGRAGRVSNNEFRRLVLEGIATYVDHGGAADRYILWPFHPYPDHSTPDDLGPLPPEGASQMRVFREIAAGAAAQHAPRANQTQ